MRFFLNKTEQEKINRLLETSDYNDEVATFLNHNVINENFIDEFTKVCEIKKLDINDYLSDHYYQSVHSNTKSKGYELKIEHYRPYQCFLYDDITVDEDDYFLIKNHVGYFTSDYPYLTIQKDHIIWMSLIPHEINTMKKAAHSISKQLYVLGLGLGYYPSLLSAQVDKITIIEKDPMVIALFKQNILPQLDYKEKYEIVQADAYKYAHALNINTDVFCDLWHNEHDGLEPYLKLKKILKNHPHVHYWIEESLIAAIRHLLINLIEEELYHTGEFNYQNEKSLEDHIINQFHHHFLNYEVKTYDDIKKILQTKYLKDLASELY
ncbi:MAG: hypothetical protein MJ207_02405 [Bacilli bacterium]|nr:hypothetical protein [Bacilli bacterium]